MTRSWNTLWLIALVMTLGMMHVACDEDSTGDDDTSTADMNSDGGTDAGNDSNTGGNFIEESGDWPDCITDCANEAPVQQIDLRSFDADGLRGSIDAECHDYFGPDTMGPDRDVIQVIADPRSMVDITVEPDGGGDFRAVLITVDGGTIMNFATLDDDGSTASHVRYAHPHINAGLPMYIVIEHLPNYLAYNPPHTDCSAFVGDLGYTVRFSAVPFEANDLGTLSQGGTLSASGELTRGGDVQYFTFMADGAANFNVTATRTGAPDFEITLVGLNTIEGQAVWDTVLHTDGSSSQTLDQTQMRACQGDCAGTMYQYGFAVLDWNGESWPGSFSYDVTVTGN